MSEKSYVDLVLEVATELELTVKGKPLFDILEACMQRLSQLKAPKADIVSFDVKDDGGDPDGKAVGRKFTFSITFKVATVLAGRQVDPRDVAAIFVPDANGRCSIEVQNLPDIGDCFVLTQRQIIDEQLIERSIKLVATFNEAKAKLASLNTLLATMYARKALIEKGIATANAKAAEIAVQDKSPQSIAVATKQIDEIIAMQRSIEADTESLKHDIERLKELGDQA